MKTYIKNVFFADLDTFIFWCFIVAGFFNPVWILPASVFFITLRIKESQREIMKSIKGDK